MSVSQTVGIAAPVALATGTVTDGGVGSGTSPGNAQGDAYTKRRLTVAVPGLADLACDIAYKGAATKGTVLFLAGEGGDTWWTAAGPTQEGWIEAVRALGWQVVQTKWTASWFGAVSGQQTGIAQMAARPAAVINWVHDNLASTARFVVTGNSGGASAVAYALTHYNLASKVDHLIPTSGPPHADLARGCLLQGGFDYSQTAQQNVDEAYGYLTTGGPCDLADATWERRWHLDSVIHGPHRSFPNTDVDIAYGTADTMDPQVKARVDETLNVIAAKTRRRYRVPNVGHKLANDASGRYTIRAILETLPVIRQDRAAQVASGTSVSATLHYAPKVGSLLVAVHRCTGGVQSGVTVPAGWTLSVNRDGAASHLAVYHRVADGTETGALTWSHPTAGEHDLVVTELERVGSLGSTGSNANAANATALDLADPDAAAPGTVPFVALAACSAPAATAVGWTTFTATAPLDGYVNDEGDGEFVVLRLIADKLLIGWQVFPTAAAVSTTANWTTAASCLGVVATFV